METIRNGNIRLGEDTAELLGIDIGAIFAIKSIEDTKFTTDNESQGNKICAIYCKLQDSIENRLDIFGISKKERGGLDASLLRSWFDARGFEAYLSVNVAILLTIYCKVFNVLHQKLWNTCGIYEIHSELVDKCSATIIDDSNATIMRNIARKDMNTFVYKNGIAIVAFPSLDTEILSQHFLRIKIWHSQLGEVADDRIDATNILHPPYGKSLVDAFLLFKAQNKLSEYSLFQAETQQVVGTSWLLTLIGYRTIVLGAIERKEESTIGGIHSADILSYKSETDALLIVDCTISIPGEPKIIKIKNTAEYVRNKIKNTAIPVIFSPVDCHARKAFALGMGVTVVDKGDIERLIESIVMGRDVNTLFQEILRVH
jgi:hypothetical protein